MSIARYATDIEPGGAESLPPRSAAKAGLRAEAELGANFPASSAAPEAGKDERACSLPRSYTGAPEREETDYSRMDAARLRELERYFGCCED